METIMLEPNHTEEIEAIFQSNLASTVELLGIFKINEDEYQVSHLLTKIVNSISHYLALYRIAMQLDWWLTQLTQ